MTAIIAAHPPNIDAIDAVFHVKATSGVIYAYAPDIYFPPGKQLPPWLMAHEEVHIRQQNDMGGPEPWWEKYLIDPQFRLDQELEAHRVEYSEYCKQYKSIWQRYTALDEMSKRLASAMYGGVITREEARMRIAA